MANLTMKLANSLSSFDGMISTSNHVIDEVVWVETTAPICWTVEVRSMSLEQ